MAVAKQTSKEKKTKATKFLERKKYLFLVNDIFISWSHFIYRRKYRKEPNSRGKKYQRRQSINHEPNSAIEQLLLRKKNVLLTPERARGDTSFFVRVVGDFLARFLFCQKCQIGRMHSNALETNRRKICIASTGTHFFL